MTQTPDNTPVVHPAAPFAPAADVPPTPVTSPAAPVPSGQAPAASPEPLTEEISAQSYPGVSAPAQSHPMVSAPVPHGAPARPYPGAPAQSYSGTPGQPPVGPPHHGTPSAGGGTPQPARKRGWMPVVSAAAIAAVLASAGTAGTVMALTGNGTQSSSLAQVGKTEEETSRAVPVSNSTSENPDWEAVTKAVSPSVVAIQVASEQGEAEGSGVVIDDAGHIVTNNHVVSGATKVQVTLSDGRIFDAKIVGTDPTTDLAVVQIQDAPDDLVPASFGDSDKVTTGSSVLAVGNPLGLANTATTGIVSALDRPVSASGEQTGTSVVTNAIQIDAAINPGNSGGPLFNAQGEVIGITSSIATLSNGSSQSGSIGLGFAIPINLAKNIGQQLIDSGTAQHAFLGVSLSDATATADGVTRRGAKVEEITSGSAAKKAGLKVGDVIVAIDQDPVSGAESLTGFVREKEADKPVTLTVVRDGAAQDVQATLAAKAAEATDEGSDQNGSGSQDEGSNGNDLTNPNNLPWDFGQEG